MLWNIIGTQRSGSNLLRLMLNAHPKISAPHPPHILSNFFPVIHSYGSLQIPANFSALAADVCEFVKLNRVPWINGIPDPSTLISLCEEPDLFHLFYSLLYYKAKTEGKSYFVNKSMSDYSFAKQFEQRGIKALYIHLVRNGKANAHSFMNSPIGDKHPYILGKNWAQDQEACLKLEDEIPAERFIRVKYEELLGDPKSTLVKICNKVDLEFDENMIRYHETEEAIITAQAGPLWKHVINKPMTEKIDSSKLLSAENCCLFEAAASETLKKMGYTTDCKLPMHKDNIDEDTFDIENKLMKAKLKTGNSVSDGQLALLQKRNRH